MLYYNKLAIAFVTRHDTTNYISEIFMGSTEWSMYQDICLCAGVINAHAPA